MINISILYPNEKGGRFDMGYYLEKHMPWSIGLLSTHKGFQSVRVERGIMGAVPGTDPAYVAICHFLFDSLDDFAAAIAVHGAELQADMRNYTDLTPLIQVSEVLIQRGIASTRVVPSTLRPIPE